MWEERERSELAMEQLASQLGATQVGEGPSTRGGGAGHAAGHTQPIAHAAPLTQAPTLCAHQLSYVGHSQGGGLLLMLLSRKPEYNDRVSVGINLAPVASSNA